MIAEGFYICPPMFLFSVAQVIKSRNVGGAGSTFEKDLKDVELNNFFWGGFNIFVWGGGEVLEVGVGHSNLAWLEMMASVEELKSNGAGHMQKQEKDWVRLVGREIVRRWRQG